MSQAEHDLERYLSSDDARNAPAWQLVAIAMARLALAKPLSHKAFVELRRAIAAAV